MAGMCISGKEEQDPSSKGNGLECDAKELSPYLPGLREPATNLNRGVTQSEVHFRTMSGDDAEDGLERNELNCIESNKAAKQTRQDTMRIQTNRTAVGMKRH